MTTAHTPTPVDVETMRDWLINGGHVKGSKATERAAFIVRACNSHAALVAALKAAAKLAWEVGCETDDGVMTLLEDSRGDLYRQITAAIAQAGEGA